MPPQFLVLLRVVTTTAGKAALQRALPLYLGMGVISAVIFEGNGLRPQQLTDLAKASLAFRLAFWGAWLVLAMPAARALLRAPAMHFLRSLPVPRWQHLTAHALLLWLAELPWAALWARGAGVLFGCAAGAAAMAAHALGLSWSRGGAPMLAAVLLSFAIASAAPALLLLAIAAPAVVVGVHAAWLHAPEIGAGREPPLVVGPPVVALALAYGAALFRAHRAVLLRGLLLAALGTGATAIWARSSGDATGTSLAQASLLAIAPVAICAGASIAGPVLVHEARIGWLLDVGAASQAVRTAARVLAVAAPSAVLGGLHGAVLGAAARAAPIEALRVVAGSTTAALLLGGVALGCVRWADRRDGRDSARALLSVLAAVSIAMWLAWSLGEHALGAYALGAATLILPSAVRDLGSARDRGAPPEAAP